MKNILYIAYYYPPMKSGGTLRTEKFVKHLKQAGYRVCVLTAAYGQNRFDADQDIIRVKDISHNKNRRGMRKLQWFALRTWTEIQKKIGRYHSIYHWWRENAWRQRDQIMDLARPDLVIATYPPVETLELAHRLSETFHLPLISDFRDGLLFEPIEQRLLRKSRTVRDHYARLEKQAVAGSAWIATASEPITGYFLRHYPGCRAETVYTGFDPESDSEATCACIADHDDTFLVVYTGRFSLSDSSSSLEGFVFAMESLLRQRPEAAVKIRFLIAGEMSAGERKLLSRLERQGVVSDCGLLERKQAIALQKRADLLLLVASASRTSVVTTKVFEYLSAAKPILALSRSDGAAARIITRTRSGWVVPPGDSARIRQTLASIIFDPGFRESLNRDEAAIASYATGRQVAAIRRQIEKLVPDSKISRG